MHPIFFLTVVLIVFSLSASRVNAYPIKNKATPDNNKSQTAGINTKRDNFMTPSYYSSSNGMNAGGGVMQPKEQPDQKENESENDTIPTPQPVVVDPKVTTIRNGFAGVKASLNALVTGTQRDDSIVDKIKKTAPVAMQLLEQLETQFDPNNITPSRETFSKLVQTIAGMAAEVVEQDDDADVHKLLSSLANSLHTVELDFRLFAPPPMTPSAPAVGTPPDLSGVDSAVNGQQEA